MSRENVAIARSIYAAWSRGDFSSLDWADPEIEYVIVDGPEPGSCRGRATMGGNDARHLESLGERSHRGG